MDDVSDRTFWISTRIVSGLGARRRAGNEITRIVAEPRVALVVDGSLADSPLLGDVTAGLEPDAIVAHEEVRPDPTSAAVEAMARRCRDARVDVVLGIGGGSALTAARAVSVMATNDLDTAALVGWNRADRAPLPCVAIPTTAGSGCEVSNAIVLRGDGRHFLLRGHGYEPTTAILDGGCLRTLPDAPLIHAAFDALSHALEALWVSGASRLTDALATGAARTIRSRLPVALSGREPSALQDLIEASATANLACGSAGLGLVHAFSSSSSIDLPHGLQNALLLPHVAQFNRRVVGPDARDEIDNLAELYDRVGLTPSFEDRNLTPAEEAAVFSAGRAHPFRSSNRRPSTDDDLRAILRDAGITLTHSGDSSDAR